MILNLYQNNSEPDIVDKNITLAASVSGTMRDSTSIINPTFRIEGDVTVSAINYIQCPDLGRYYFVSDVISVRNNCWDLICHVDVLSTWKTELRRLSAIIARQENLYNLYLDDDKLLTTSRRLYWTKAFPVRVYPASAGGSSMVLTLAGGAKTT